jgi:hypothetical protein
MSRTLIQPIISLAIALFGCSESSTRASATGLSSGARPELSELDARFTVSEGPFVIRSGRVGEHVAFPDIARVWDGRILLVYREATRHSVDPLGRLVKQIGEADASTWSEPETLYDATLMDDRDPSITTLADGTLALNYFQYRLQATPDGPLTNYQVFYGESQDDGASFGPFSILSGRMTYPNAELGSDGLWRDENDQAIEVSACSSAMFELDGRVHAQLYSGPPYMAAHPDSPRSRVIVASTDDHGETWTKTLVAPEHASNLWLQEPAILPLDEHRWLLHVRVAEGDSPNSAGAMRQAISEDGGVTWSSYRAFDFIGQAPYLARLSSGVLMSAFRWYDDLLNQSGVNFIYSMDEGQTWSEMIRIVEPQLDEIGYPSILELDDGRVLIVYYVAGTSIEGVIYDVELISRG